MEHRDAFMQSLRAGPQMRARIFESLEREFGREFANGRAGGHLYDTFHSAVEEAAIPGALAEFEDRFLPLVNGQRLPAGVESQIDQPQKADAAHGGSWITAISAVVLVIGVLALGLFVVNAVLARPPVKGKPASAAQATKQAPPRIRPANPVRTLDEGPASSAPNSATGTPPRQ